MSCPDRPLFSPFPLRTSPSLLTSCAKPCALLGFQPDRPASSKAVQGGDDSLIPFNAFPPLRQLRSNVCL